MNARLSVQGDGENGKDDGPGGEGVAQGRDSVSKVPRSVSSGHVGIDVCHRVARVRKIFSSTGAALDEA